MKNRAVVILHGWGLSAAKFQWTNDVFESHGYDVFVPDLPGFGESIIPKKPLRLQNYATFLEKYLKKNHIQHPIVIGHSFGGRVAICFAATHRGMIGRLVLTGTPGFSPVAKKRLILFVAIAKFGKLLFSLPLLSKMGQNVKNWYYYSVGAREYTRAQGAMKETFKNVVTEKLDTYMQAIDIPCLLAWGEKDIITPVGIAQRMLPYIKGSKLVIISDTDHGVSYKQPELFYTSIFSFLK